MDAGRIFVAPKVEVGYLEQTAVSGSERTVWEEARSRMTALIAAEMAMEFAAAEAERGERRRRPRPCRALEACAAAVGPACALLRGAGSHAGRGHFFGCLCWGGERSAMQAKDTPPGVCARDSNVPAAQRWAGAHQGL